MASNISALTLSKLEEKSKEVLPLPKPCFLKKYTKSIIEEAQI